ncbi:MAG: hypothetical protein BZ136_08860 [Methanosphaera sp. rholeuAM74]|nr:MAG: hypothetical protein BZ136_08860 [Methanosphaera sp. rholeuAM74]
MSHSTEKIYSHPDKLLTTHLFNVATNSRKIFEDIDTDDDFLPIISFFVGLTHDFAKCTSFFQNHLFNNTRSPKAHHSFLSAILTYYVIKSHIEENSIETDTNYPVLAYLVVKNHHGNLKNVFDEHKNFKENMDVVDVQVNDILGRNLASFNEFYLQHGIDINRFLANIDSIKQDLKKDLFKLKMEDKLENYTNLILLFSVLIDSDKLDASYTDVCERIQVEGDIVDKYKDEQHFSNEGINNVRQRAYDEVNNQIEHITLNDKLYSISLPTGLGKTMTALSFAMKLRNKILNERGVLPRVIYSLPFLSIIDQNEEVIKEILRSNDYNSQDVFIKHNSTSEIYYKTREDEELEIDNAELLIESWYSEIIITTFYQVLYTIISNKNRSLKKLHNLNNSILIFDEVQSIPPKYWKLINVLLKNMAKKYNIWIIFMTATQPAIFDKSVMLPLIEDTDYYFNKFDRVNYVFNLEKQSIDDFKEFIVEETFADEKDIMIVVNTIQNSIDIFKYLSEYLPEHELYYLSTNILPFERKQRISSIKNTQNRKIIVTTQLIEAGVDIDVDIIYRDFAPIDNIIQTAGRCNRNQLKDKGTVNIIKLVNEKGVEFNSYIYDTISRETTHQLIKDIDSITEKEFIHTLGKYYEQLNEKISKEKSNDILDQISKLEITNITHDFNLIEQQIEKEDVFIDMNKESHEIWTKYEEINTSNKKRYYKKREFEKIKSEFRKYILSIDIQKIRTLPLKYGIFYMDKQDAERKYDKQLGFISLEDEEAFII